MIKKFALLLILVSTFGCKKDIEFSDDDTNLYRWKRDFYRAGVQKDAPAFFCLGMVEALGQQRLGFL